MFFSSKSFFVSIIKLNLILASPVQIYRLEKGVNLQEKLLNKPKLFPEIPYGDRNDHAERIK